MVGEGGNHGQEKRKNKIFLKKLNIEYWSSLKFQTTQKRRNYYLLLSKSKEYNLGWIVNKQGMKLHAKFSEHLWSTNMWWEKTALWKSDAVIVGEFLEKSQIAVIPRYTKFQSVYQFSKYLWCVYQIKSRGIC